MGSLSYKKFKTKDMTEKHLLNDLSQMTELTHITLLEGLHTSKIQYSPKSVFYGTEKTVAGIQLAVLDHKTNIKKQKVYTNLCKYKLD